MLLEDESSGVVKSADRVLDVIELLARWGREMSHTEIADTLEIPKSSLTKLLKNLTARGFVEFVPLTKGYRLGEALIKINDSRRRRMRIELRQRRLELLPRRRDGHPQRPRQPAARGEDGKQHKSQKRAQVNNSLDEEWVAGRWPLVVGLWEAGLGRWSLLVARWPPLSQAIHSLN